jgi:nicotinamide phosphoribosyltransferase
MSDFMALTDFYKVDHRRQYPANTTMVYSNFTARASRIPEQKYTVFAGLQYFLQKYLQDAYREWRTSHFRVSYAQSEYKRLIDSGLGPNDITVDHIGELYKLGYIPLRFFALPEGSHVPLRVPMFTFVNTHPDFARR